MSRAVARSRPSKPPARRQLDLRSRLLSAVLAAACAFPLCITAAQEVPPPISGLVVGRVTDTLGVPLSYCFVRVENAKSAVLCDSTGRFRLAGLPRAATTFEVRRLGYTPGRFTVAAIRDSMPITVELVPFPTELRPISVTAPAAPSYQPWLVQHGFYDRMRAGATAMYVTPDELERLKPERVTDVVRTRPGVRITYSGGAAGQSRTPLVWGRGYCLLNVFVDGIEVRGIYFIPEGVRRGGVEFVGSPGWRNLGDAAMSKALMPITGIGLDEFILPSSIAAMEIYPSGAATPLEFRAANGCGAIVIWTKVGTRIPPGDSGTSRAPAADTSGVQ